MAYKITLEGFIGRSKAAHGDKYDYSLVEYVRSTYKVKIICPIHGVFLQRPVDHYFGHGCAKCGFDGNRQRISLDQSTFFYQANKRHNNKFDYSKSVFMGVDVPINITCPIHGDFKQTPYNHISARSFGCPLCYKESRGMRHDDFMKKAIEKHGDKYIYDKARYVNSNSKVVITCRKHGDFLQNPSFHLFGGGCPVCKGSKGESAIKSGLDKLGVVYHYQHGEKSSIFGNHRYDFYIPSLNLFIEYNGKQHYEPISRFGGTERFQWQQDKDYNKMLLAHYLGVTLRVVPYNRKNGIKELMSEIAELQNNLFISTAR